MPVALHRHGGLDAMQSACLCKATGMAPLSEKERKQRNVRTLPKVETGQPLPACFSPSCSLHPRQVQSFPMSEEKYLALQVMMMPRDANPIPVSQPGAQGAYFLTIFGGVILSYIDQAGAIGARHEIIQAGGPLPVLVSVAMNRVEFKKPVIVGDVVRFLTRLVRMGHTSITMHVNVEAERGKDVLHVTEAEVVYVGIDATSPERRPVALLQSQ